MEKRFEDFKKLSATRQLDFILNSLNDDDLPLSITQIESKLKWATSDIKIDKLLNIILGKLKEDKYVIEKHREEIKGSEISPEYHPAEMTYYISFEGKLFFEKKGYARQLFIDKSNYCYGILKNVVLILVSILTGILAFLNIFNHCHPCK